MRPTRACVAALLVAVAFGASGPGAALADEMSTGRIQIEYVPPKNPDHEALYEQLMERQSLEKISAILKPFRLPQDVKIRTVGCDGVSNAWYQPINGVPTVTVCYEYLDDLWKRLPMMMTHGVDEPTQTDALVGQMFFAFAHEFGHLVFDVYDVPVFGHEEDAADNFATYIMLQFQADAPRLIMGAAWSYRAFIKNLRENPKTVIPLTAFSSNHGQPEERFFNLECMAYGSDPKRYAELVEKGLLPQSRARDCSYEYDVMKFAFDIEILPHIDMAMANQVLAQDWLAGAPPPRALR
ncbi:MAG TPA: DUF4344 domain-containing metallopeptidase [Xanthobacteraceae bacterium]|nr:DUF4344 domain-containing metallopeptidase [Xanthobacteraceae bacterium]